MINDTNKKPLEPKPFLPKKGNYRALLVYQKAECLYDITFYFAHHYFVERKDRTIDQLIQAVRSGKQNIAEGSSAATTSSETELKLMGVARARMKEVLEDYIDYLRTRGLEQWAVNDPRTKQIQEYSKKHNRPEDYTTDIDKRSPEALCNIAITLIHQFDNMMGKLLDRLQKDFVELGGIRERMTAARLGYRNGQKTRIEELETENSQLKAKIAELEERLKSLISPMSLISLILLTLLGCGGGSSEDDLAAPQVTGVPGDELVPITFNGYQGNETAETRANSGTPLYEVAKKFQVWGYKNMSAETQEVFPCYQVDWHANSAATSATNTNNWDYIGTVASQTIKFWDWSAQAYRFFAVTGWSGAAPPEPPATYEANKAYGAYGANNETYSVSMLVDASPVLDGEGKYDKDATDAKLAEAPYFSRLWYSTGNPTDYPDKQFGKPVTLEFVQPYARVRFVFIYVYPREGINLTEKSFKPTDGSKIYRKGTVTVSYPLTGTSTIESYTTHEVETTDTTYICEDYDPENDGKVYTKTNKGWYTVVPNTSQGSYTLSVKVNGAVKTAVVPAEYMQWKPGYGYTYIFKITDEGGIKIGWVDYAVTPWTEMQADRTVYNW